MIMHHQLQIDREVGGQVGPGEPCRGYFLASQVEADRLQGPEMRFTLSRTLLLFNKVTRQSNAVNGMFL